MSPRVTEWLWSVRHRCLRKSSRITHADQSPHNADLVSLAPSRIWRALITPGYSQIVQLGVEWPIEAVWSLTLHGATRLNRGFGKDQSGTDGVSGTLCLWTLDPDTECRDSLRYPRKSRMCRTTGPHHLTQTQQIPTKTQSCLPHHRARLDSPLSTHAYSIIASSAPSRSSSLRVPASTRVSHRVIKHHRASKVPTAPQAASGDL